MKCKRLTLGQAQDLLTVALGINKPWSAMLRNDSIDVGASKLIRVCVRRNGESGGRIRWFIIGPVFDVEYWFELV